MDPHFDFNTFHPTFVNGTHDFSDHGLGHVGLGGLMDDFMARAREYSFPADVVNAAAAGALNFFNHPDLPIFDYKETGVFCNNPYTYFDDAMGFSRDQLHSMGINTQESLSLVFTHEIGHCFTQLLLASGQITRWESELISDSFMGARAQLEGLSTDAVYHSFDNSHDSDTHPGGDLRHEFIEIGREIVKEMNYKQIPFTYDGYMARLGDHLRAHHDEISSREAEQQRIAHQQAANQPQPTQMCYTQDEINQHLREAQNKIDHLKSVIRDHTHIMENRVKAKLPCDSEKYTIGAAKVDLENAIKDRNRWANERPTKS